MLEELDGRLHDHDNVKQVEAVLEDLHAGHLAIVDVGDGNGFRHQRPLRGPHTHEWKWSVGRQTIPLYINI